MAETSISDPGTSGLFLHHLRMPTHLLYLKYCLIIEYHGQEERKLYTGHTRLLLHWVLLGCSCCVRDWTALFAPFFVLFQIRAGTYDENIMWNIIWKSRTALSFRFKKKKCLRCLYPTCTFYHKQKEFTGILSDNHQQKAVCDFQVIFQILFRRL